MKTAQMQVCPIRVMHTMDSKVSEAPSGAEESTLDVWAGTSFSLVPASRAWGDQSEQGGLEA